MSTITPQGQWSEEEYLALDTNHLVEFCDGCLEVLPMVTIFHQRLVAFLHEILRKFVADHTEGHVLTAPLPVHLRPGKFREPHISFLRPYRLQNIHRHPAPANPVLQLH